MPPIAKITPADYADLLAADEAGVSHRELARRYDCARSLVARHLARAKRARESGEFAEHAPGSHGEPHSGSLREILEARIRDPRTSARDLASLTNALPRLQEEAAPRSGGPSILDFPRGTLILEPVPRGRDLYRLLLRVRGGLEHVSDPQYDLDGDDALYLIRCALGSASGLKADDLPGHPLRARGAKLMRRFCEEREAIDDDDPSEAFPEGVYVVYPSISA